MLSPGN